MKTMADRQNEEIDKFQLMKQQKMQKDLKDAMKQDVNIPDLPMSRSVVNIAWPMWLFSVK